MYQTYLWKIKPMSSYITPWQSDTIYGHLLWGIKLFYGEDEINATIKEFEEKKPPFIVSNGFSSKRVKENGKEKLEMSFPIPKKSLPKRADSSELAKKHELTTVEVVNLLKKINKIKEVRLDDFNKLRGNYSNIEFVSDLLSKKNEDVIKSQASALVMHNSINRLSGTTEENNLFSLEENFAEEICIYIKVRSDYPIGKIEKLLSFIEGNGFGKKASAGKGAIETISFGKFDGFTKVDNANGFIVLSNYIPKANDYTKIVSGNTVLKIGKVANIDGNEDFPFKKPFTCFSAGSIFIKGENEISGKVLRDIHIDKKIVQIGIPFTLEVIV
ncbi:type III-A CRISPR-associated RAMP protein Csm4 [Fusobacterium sp. PH5-44]|uniref:type III-A CRISPR-associated RAMP protein Csm4 n=1 Tax=unclassified Fusobacterium TaxID=2648384 RepID=UPI003D205B64